MEDNLIDIIEAYAAAYDNLETFQSNNPKLLPKGDQKTGVIGEYLGLKILKQKYNKKNVVISENHSQKGFDVIVETGRNTEYYQIKTISEFSKTGVSSKINYTFKLGGIEKKLDGILVILLNKTLLCGSYVIIDSDIERLNGKRLSRINLLKNGNPITFNLEDLFNRKP